MFGNRQISDFVNDKKLVVRIPFQNPFECSFFISCLEFLNQLMTVDEDGFDALMAGFHAEGSRQMRFPDFSHIKLSEDVTGHKIQYSVFFLSLLYYIVK